MSDHEEDDVNDSEVVDARPQAVQRGLVGREGLDEVESNEETVTSYLFGFIPIWRTKRVTSRFVDAIFERGSEGP